MRKPEYGFDQYLKPKKENRVGRLPVAIYTRDGDIYYSFNETEIGYKEDSLELYQELQKKKLYAYRVLGSLGEVKTYIQELGQEVCEVNNLMREPDYDLDYPCKEQENTEVR